MQRRTASLADTRFDVVVVGGGIFGICTAWAAALRGLSVALVEKGDFASATSASCFKMVHGGIRYLQHGDLVRLRQSAGERNVLLRVAPHLVSPLPIAIPTYGRGTRGRAFLAAGAYTYDLLTADRNAGIRDPSRRIPGARLWDRDEALANFPDLDRDGLTGAVLIHDAQMYSAHRLGIAILRAAVDHGAVAANYVEATALATEGNRVSGIVAQDRETGERFEVRGRVTVNAAGPWAEGLLQRGLGRTLARPSSFSRDTFLVTRRPPLAGGVALAASGRTRDPDALLSRSARHLFIVPWRERMIVGVWHKVVPARPDEVSVAGEELDQFIDEINWASPGLELRRTDVSMWSAGLVLFGENEPGAVNLSYGKRSRLIDHAVEHGLDGLVSLVGVRYTTARLESERAMDLVVRKLGVRAGPARTDREPVHGGAFGDFDALVAEARAGDSGTPAGVVEGQCRRYGTTRRDVAALAGTDPALASALDASDVTGAEIVHAVRSEMAVRLSDAVLGRTQLGAVDCPSPSAVQAAARIMGAELGWDEARRATEVDALYAWYRRRGFDTGGTA